MILTDGKGYLFEKQFNWHVSCHDQQAVSGTILPAIYMRVIHYATQDVSAPIFDGKQFHHVLYDLQEVCYIVPLLSPR